MKLLERYIFRQYATTFLLLVMGLPLLFTIIDITDSLDRYLARGISMAQVALSYVYYQPQAIFWSMPVAALIATVFTIGNMTRHQELTAAKAGGVSFYRVIRPIILLAVLLSALAVGLGELIPVTNGLRAEALGERTSTSTTLRTNFVYQTEEGRVLGSRRLDVPQSEMVNVTLEREATGDAGGSHAMATRARWQPGIGWTLENGRLRLLDSEGVEQTFTFSSMRIPRVTETPADLLADPKEAEEMRFQEMGRSIETLQRSGGDPLELHVERSNRIALPVAILVIVLFGAPLSTSSKRGGAAYGIGISLAVTMVYLMLFQVGSAMGESGAMDPVVATWIPNGVFLIAGLVLLGRVRT